MLDGLRVYLGAYLIDRHAIPKIHLIACEKDNENRHNDFEPESENFIKQNLHLVAHGKLARMNAVIRNLFKQKRRICCIT